METAGATELFRAADDCRGFFFQFPIFHRQWGEVACHCHCHLLPTTNYYYVGLSSENRSFDALSRWNGLRNNDSSELKILIFLGHFENITDIFLGIVCHVIWYLRWFSHVLAFICKPLQNVMVKRHISKGANKETFEMWFLEMRF